MRYHRHTDTLKGAYTMANEKEIIKTAEAAEQTESGNVVKLTTPYKFEGKEYSEIDLGGLDKLTIQDAIDAQLELFSQQEVASSMLCETTTAFARTIATKATDLPVEFFKLAPRGVSKRVGAAIRAHLNVEQETENHVVRFAKPYFYKGKQYNTVDLGGIADLNSMNESEAENRMTRAGFVITENSFNYLYACILASMAANLPEDFFTGLPLCELVKLKNAVNDAGFFE